MSARTPELEAIIVEGLSEGVPLRQLARLHGFGKSAFYEWCKEDAELAGRIAHARELGFDAIAEEALEIADDGTNDWTKRESADGSTGDDVLNGEHVQRSKLRIETAAQAAREVVARPIRREDRSQAQRRGHSAGRSTRREHLGANDGNDVW
jgi:hypothetical protein